jgi:hypothetical protein
MSTPAPSPTPPITGPVIIYDARITDIAPTVVSEQVAEVVTFSYNALTQGASLSFQSRAYMYVNAEPQQMAGTSPDYLSQAVNEAMEIECFGIGLRDPVTGEDLSGVSTAGVGLIIKAAFAILYNRRAQGQGSPNPDQAYPSELALIQTNYLYDMYGNGLGGYPLGKAFGGLGTTDGVPTPSPAPTPPNPLNPSPTPAPNAS